MNSKILIGIIILILVIIAAFLLIKIQRPAVEEKTVTTEASDLSSVMTEEYETLIQEELENLSIEQTDFNNQIEDQIAEDLSQFYYE